MSMQHHGDNDHQSELLKLFREQQEGQAKRQWPQGRIDGTDDGQIAFKVGGDAERGVVVIDFGKPVAWTAMSPQEAVQLAQMLIKHARAIATEPVRVVL